MAALNDGTVLVTGGYDDSTRVSANSILVDPELIRLASD